MAHVPHLLLSGPWASGELQVSSDQRSHLENVLRAKDGDPVSYTDGRGILGEGRYRAGSVTRGKETRHERPTDLVLVAAPPDDRQRVRFMVEKLSELGVAELRFLATRYGQGRPQNEAKLRGWAVSGLEQSRGAWLMATSTGLVTFADITGPFVVCDAGGSRENPHARTVVIGPEGGWAPDEVPIGAVRYDLGDTVLRVETAAIVAAARMM
jgi:16S rRNA (uracil1498-N3)-methyltransferase